jgi:hypothetical protein
MGSALGFDSYSGKVVFWIVVNLLLADDFLVCLVSSNPFFEVIIHIRCKNGKTSGVYC